MTINYARRIALSVTLAATLSGGFALAATSAAGSTPKQTGKPTTALTVQPKTPNECILLNGGDYNACNVGNSGRGDLPYRPVK